MNYSFIFFLLLPSKTCHSYFLYPLHPVIINSCPASSDPQAQWSCGSQKLHFQEASDTFVIKCSRVSHKWFFIRKWLLFVTLSPPLKRINQYPSCKGPSGKSTAGDDHNGRAHSFLCQSEMKRNQNKSAD